MSKISFKRLDNYEIPSLLKTIKIIKNETKSYDRNIDKINYWIWRYKKLPSKRSLVYVATDKKKIIGYYHIPVYDFNIKGKKYKIGSIQSVAITKKFRDKNIFRRLSDFANSDAIQYLDLFYTFPNNKSINTFLKYDNFHHIVELPFYIYPIKSANLIKSKVTFYGFNLVGRLVDYFFRLFSKKLNKDEKIVFFNNFENKILDLFSLFNKKYDFYIKRNFPFLSWRYNKFSKSKYKIVGLEKNNKLKSVAIVKIDKIFKCKGIIIMDFAYTELEYLRKLLINIASSKFLKSNNISFILISGIAHNLDQIQRSGFLKIPSSLVPRNLNLLFKSKTKSLNNLLKNKKSWLITLSDWDVF